MDNKIEILNELEARIWRELEKQAPVQTQIDMVKGILKVKELREAIQ
jgi:hypothetical protein